MIMTALGLMAMKLYSQPGRWSAWGQL